MLLLRPAKPKDLTPIFELAKTVASGITTLPADRDVLKLKIDTSVRSFAKDVTQPSDEHYFFVLEDTHAKRIVGTSAIDAAVGGTLPFYSYKLGTVAKISHDLNVKRDTQILYLVNDHQGKTEICSLFLSPDYRKNRNSHLLSFSRFLFMAQFPERFADTVISEMRGVCNEKGESPFWNSLGKYFFPMTFREADYLTMTTNKQFIADLMPQYPIYVSLLKKNAQRVIGKIHQQTKPAAQMLKKQGFSYRGYVDIFDAGPTLEASLKKIRTIKKSKWVHVDEIRDDVIGEDLFLIANTSLLNFRVCKNILEYNEKENCVAITKEVAKLLQVKKGDGLRIIPA